MNDAEATRIVQESYCSGLRHAAGLLQSIANDTNDEHAGLRKEATIMLEKAEAIEAVLQS